MPHARRLMARTPILPETNPMIDKSRDPGARRANWLVFVVLVAVALALYASMFIKWKYAS